MSYCFLFNAISRSTHIADYVVQASRFAELEDLGCSNDVVNSVLEILIIDSWQITLPLLSALFYCREFYPVMVLPSGSPSSSTYLMDLVSPEKRY